MISPLRSILVLDRRRALGNKLIMWCMIIFLAFMCLLVTYVQIFGLGGGGSDDEISPPPPAPPHKG